MKHKIFLLLLSSLMMLSCTSVKVPGYHSGVSTELSEREYDILGDVEIEGCERSILGIFNWGGATYQELIHKAKELYNAHDVINISLDHRYSVVLGVYFSRKYYVRGLAIKYR